MATTPSGAVKLEAQKIDVELTNRVSQASISSNMLSFQNPPIAENSGSRGPPRPSNLNLCSASIPHRSSLNEQAYSSLTGIRPFLLRLLRSSSHRYSVLLVICVVPIHK